MYQADDGGLVRSVLRGAVSAAHRLPVEDVAEGLSDMEDGAFVLCQMERALKKSGWRGPRETGAQRQADALDRGRTEREERGHGW